MNYRSILNFLKKETVLCAAVVLAAVSCFWVHPDSGYFSYIDFRTLALLFCLMAVMAGLREQGVFSSLGRSLLSRTRRMRQVLLVLVLLCFFCSMVITNDVALITFIPFTFAVLDMLGPETRRVWVLPVVCMQTIAANLGSMFTPIGNPQNLYLYGKSGLDLPAFLCLMLPYTLGALILLVGWLLILCRRQGGADLEPMNWQTKTGPAADRRKILLHTVLFLLCLMTVIRVLPWQILSCVVLAAVLAFDRGVLLKIDGSLLLTFVGFFVFIGNLGRVPAFSEWLRTALSGREVSVAVLASQVISNVPTALLLSGFTNRTADLIVGTNLGGLGTLIASMASLISFRQIAEGERERKGAYFMLFTVSNVIFLAILMGIWWLVSGCR